MPVQRARAWNVTDRDPIEETGNLYEEYVELTELVDLAMLVQRPVEVEHQTDLPLTLTVRSPQ